MSMRGQQRKKLFTAEVKLLNKLESMSDIVDFPQPDPALGAPPDSGSVDQLRSAIHDLQTDLLENIRALMEEQKAALALENGSNGNEAEQELKLLKTEIRALGHAIQQTKSEIAALYKSQEDENRLVVVKHELDSVVAATEEATADILEAVEKIDQTAHNIRSAASDDYVQGLADDVIDLVVKVFESCNFQDLTGQRITKVVNTMKYIEDRISKVVEIWGDDDFGDFDVAAEPKGLDNLDKTITAMPDNVERITQDEIDKLFD